MAGTVRHVFTSPKTDATDTSLVRPSDWNSSHALTLDSHHVTLSGNTAGALALVSTGTMTLAGGNNITVSQAGNAITISGPNVGGAQTGISGISNSETMYTSGTVNLSVVGGPMTIRSTTGQAFQFSVSQSVQAETQTFVGGIKNTETTYTSGTVELEGTNNITVFSTTGQRLRISGANTHAQQTGISALSNSNTTYTSGTVGLSELGAITIRSTTGNQFQFSVNAQTVQTQGVTQDEVSIGVSTGGNTAGNTTVNTGQRFVLVGSNGITLSQGTGAGSTTVTISGVTTAAQTNQSAIKALGVSNTGNTAGNTGVSTGIDWVIAGSNNITASESTAAGGPNTVWISGANPGAAQFSIGVSNLGNTAGSTGVTGTRYVFVGTNNITLSQSTDATGGTVSISGAGAAAPTLSYWRNISPQMQSASGPGATMQVISNASRTLNVFPLELDDPLFPGNMTVSTMFMGPWQQSESTATMSAANTVSVSIGIYTLNGSTLSLLNSASTSWGAVASTNNSTSTAGIRWLTIHSSNWSVNPTFSQTQYWMASVFNTAGSQMTRTQWLWGVYLFNTAALSGTMGVATANATTMGTAPFYGIYSATTTALPASIGSAELNKQSAFVGLVPQVLFNNQVASF